MGASSVSLESCTSSVSVTDISESDDSESDNLILSASGGRVSDFSGIVSETTRLGTVVSLEGVKAL